MTEWTLTYDGYDPDEEGLREALCTLGNGVLATRGAAPESRADGVHYPATYLAGLFNRLTDEVDGVAVTNESIVNLPNWLVLQVRIGDGPWLDLDSSDWRVDDHRLSLDLRRGVLTRHLTATDPSDRTIELTQRRLVHLDDPQVAALETTIVARGFSGDVTVRSAIDAGVRNQGVARYSDLSDRHLEVLDACVVDEETVALTTETNQSKVRIAQATRTRVWQPDGIDTQVQVQRDVVDDDDLIGQDLHLEFEDGQAITVVKSAVIVSGRDPAVSEPTENAVRKVARLPAFEALLDSHVAKWNQLWDRFEIRFGEREEIEQVLNLHTFHALQTTSHNTIDRDVGVPARGLHGEAYRGHIFWDEVFVFPYLNLRMPVLTRSLLMYRYRRLDEARQRARAGGHDGAIFPWQSGSDGREESQEMHLNPKTGTWKPDNSQLQRHINLAIAYNVWQYIETTGDLDFLRYYGGELLVDIARFFASLATYDHVSDRYHLCGVMGPDEYHDAYPDRDEPGLDDNAYTNVMVVWMLRRVHELLGLLPAHARHDLWDELDLSRSELDRWEDLTRRISVPFHGEGIISQFAGYEQLEEFDWDGYRERYGDIARLDRILHAEDDTPNRYQVTKQADVLMLFYLLSAEELEDILRGLDYDWTSERIPATIEYYRKRTSHGSTLSGVVHAWLLARSDRQRSWELFQHALRSDIADIQGGTTPEGIHLGAMTGTLDLVQRGYTGLSVEEGMLRFDPALPEEIDRLSLQLYYRGHHLEVVLSQDRLRIAAPASELPPVRIGCDGDVDVLHAGDSVEFQLDTAPDRRTHLPDPATEPLRA